MDYPSVCSIPECGKTGRIIKGFCKKHYQRWKAHGDPYRYIRAAAGEARAKIYEVQATTHDECVTWPFSRKGDGYGRINWAGTMMSPARAACMVAHGAPPSAIHQVAHSCGRGAQGCFNPRHLRWDTPKGNVADRYIHGTVAFGEDNPVAKLTHNQVRQIRAMLEIGVSRKACSARYGVCYMAIANIHRGRTYKGVS
jgi:hypothetical protein